VAEAEGSKEQASPSEVGGRARNGAALTVGGVGASLTTILLATARELDPTQWFRLAALLLFGVVVIFGLGVLAVGVVLAIYRPIADDPVRATGVWQTGAPAFVLMTGLALVIVGAISVAITLLTL
jgi:hypothetical protein